MSGSTDDSVAIERRGFLAVLAATGLGFAALLTGAAVVESLVPPPRSIDGTLSAGSVAVGRVVDLQTDVPLAAQYGDQALFLVRTGSQGLSVLSQRCPHMGCALSFDAPTKQFRCPCHGSTFTLEGKRLSGPARRDMYAADFEVIDGQIVVAGLGT